MKEFSNQKNLEMEKQRLKELLEEDKALNANLAMYLRNKKKPPANLMKKIFESMSETSQLTLECYPYEPDEAALKRMEALDLKEKKILDEIRSAMPDMPVAKLAFILPVIEENLKIYMLDRNDKETQIRLDCILKLFGNIYRAYRDRYGIPKNAINELSDQLIEYSSIAGFGDYLLRKLAGLRDCVLNPTEENILTACVNMSDIMLGYNAMVTHELEKEMEKLQKEVKSVGTGKCISSENCNSHNSQRCRNPEMT